MEQPSEKMQEQDSSSKSQSAQLTQEWQRFFPGRSFGDVVKDFAYYIREHEQHEFDRYDSLLHSLDEMYFRTTEPARFLDLIQEAWQLLRQVLADSQKGLALFETFSPEGWVDINGEGWAPFRGYPQNNASRAKAALRRVEQWLKTKKSAPSDQLIAFMQTIPVAVWHEQQPGSYAKTTVSLPKGKGKDYAHMLEILWDETKREIRGKKKRIAKATRERIMEKLLPISKIEQADIDELERRQQAENGLQCLEQLPRYYPFMKWGGLQENSHVLPGAQLSIHFWHALEFSVGIRRISAEAICKKLATNEKVTPKHSPEQSSTSYSPQSATLHSQHTEEVSTSSSTSNMQSATVGDSTLAYEASATATSLPVTSKVEPSIVIDLGLTGHPTEFDTEYTTDQLRLMDWMVGPEAMKLYDPVLKQASTMGSKRTWGYVVILLRERGIFTKTMNPRQADSFFKARYKANTSSSSIRRAQDDYDRSTLYQECVDNFNKYLSIST